MTASVFSPTAAEPQKLLVFLHGEAAEDERDAHFVVRRFPGPPPAPG